MEEYVIRYATTSDICNIMKFIDENWRKDHRLATDRELFEWQYVNKNKVNMVVGVDAAGEIQGILGFIPYSSDDNKDFSLSLWKAKSGTAFLGVKLLMFLLKEEPHRHMFCNGINVGTSGQIYHRLGIKTGKLTQWYRLQKAKEYVIAKVLDEQKSEIQNNEEYKLVKINSYDDFCSIVNDSVFDKKTVPFKSPEYIKRRYFVHPMYEYCVYGVTNNSNEVCAVVFFRMQDYNNAKAMRVIDFIGDYSVIYEITFQLDCIANQENAEYIDLYEHGLSTDKMRSAGWCEVGKDHNIIPNYFAPFVQSNVEINISMTDENIVLFKGDGDQDRPN